MPKPSETTPDALDDLGDRAWDAINRATKEGKNERRELGRFIADTYPKPANGWTCFHCGETFTTPGSARDHFGADPICQPGCRIKVGEERGLQKALRLHEELQRRFWHLFDAAKRLSNEGDAATPKDWAVFHLAVADIPESQHP